ncbi:MAG: apolipoprotein N-acyltransferase [Rickettsiales bacterium]|jgi:apolipoprotein N-acyltransferase|nr:apolipoprotein N-acyltransferase [Rickettsiales bacterium]
MNKTTVLSKIGLTLLGAIGSLGFAPFYLWPIAALSIGAGYYFLRGRGYNDCFWWGAGYAVANFYWIASPISANLWYFRIAAILGLFFIVGWLFAAPFMIAARANGWRRTLYFAFGWAFMLWLREVFMLCPWNPLANIALPFARISGMMAAAGALGLTFVIAGAIAAIPEYIAGKSKRQFLFLAPLLLFIVFPDIGGGPDSPSGKSVRIVQPAFSVFQKSATAMKGHIKDTLVRLSAGIGNNVDLIVWPETAYPFGADSTTQFPDLPFGGALALGAEYRDVTGEYNSLVYIGQGGIAGIYHKVRLVPFGESRPLGRWIPGGGFKSGGGPVEIGGFAPSVCYEIAWSLSPLAPGANPEYIVNITNDAWLEGTPGLPQHLDMARRQAIETGMPVIFASYAGPSAIIDNRGAVLRKLPHRERGFLDGEIPPRRTTWYRSIGRDATMFLIALVCAAILFAFRPKSRASFVPPRGRSRGIQRGRSGT